MQDGHSVEYIDYRKKKQPGAEYARWLLTV